MATDLRTRIVEANKAYRLGRPVMSDREFDDLCEAYEKTVAPEEYAEFRNSLHEETGKVRHPFIMGSLDKLKAEEPEAVNKFLLDEGAAGGQFSVSAKIDGISCRVRYGRDGKLESATTRGDGTCGIDITGKVKYIAPSNISTAFTFAGPVDVRGELVVTFKQFEDYFAPRGFKNPRNTCAGIMNSKETDPEALRHVDFVPYEIMGGERTKRDQFAALTAMGFTPAWNTFVSFTPDEILDGRAVEKLRLTAIGYFDYPTDGLVVSLDSYTQELDEYRPKHQKAFKINALGGWTTVLDVEWGAPSKDGRMTPVAVLEAVDVGGSTITRVTLNNLEWMEGNHVKIGSRVYVCKSGDVIPKIVEVDNKDRKTVDIEPPAICPVCGAALTTRDDVDLCCPNDFCPSRNYEKVLTFIENLGIQHVSRQTLENWNITSFAKLIGFSADARYKMQVRFERDLGDKMFGAGEDTLFKALPFTGLAEKTLTKIVDFYGYRELEAGAWKGPFSSYPEGVAERTMEAFTKDAGVNFDITHTIVNDSRWHGKMFTSEPAAPVETKGSVCFTGALNTMSRGEAQAAAKAAGYEVKSGVSKGLTYLVTNDPFSGSSKNEKAKKLGTKVITEKEFLELL